uniref:CLZ domain-containing protein n=1 Tax=Toxocara canis TaxID=6265 RepID=A0A183VF06_TOXCA
LLDENAPEEQMTAEELAENLQNSLKNVQIRMARFVAEFTSTKSKLLKRIEFLESQLNRYQVPSAELPTTSEEPVPDEK